MKRLGACNVRLGIPVSHLLDTLANEIDVLCGHLPIGTVLSKI